MKYDYSLLRIDYPNSLPLSDDVLRIICSIHGEFTQKYGVHKNGGGCQKCAKKARVSTDDFIKRSKLIHGDKYDYSLVDVKNVLSKVRIICKIHGVFEQVVNNHLFGQGCNECGGRAQSTTEKFIEKAKKIHGEVYDYSRVLYLRNSKPVIIGCPEHGWFDKRPDNHLGGKGCQKCSGERIAASQRTPINIRIENFRRIHGDKYDYSRIDRDTNSKEEVTIGCPEHGWFRQTVQTHERGCGCPKCGDKLTAMKKMITLEEFIVRATGVHGDKYDYSKVVIKGLRTPIIIICKIHGEFTQLPTDHFDKCGCQKCGLISRSITRTFITLEMCIRDAKRFTSKSEWKKKSLSLYTKAWRMEWLDTCCEHMKRPPVWNKNLTKSHR